MLNAQVAIWEILMRFKEKYFYCGDGETLKNGPRDTVESPSLEIMELPQTD